MSRRRLPRFTFVLTGTSPVWKTVKITARHLQEAKDKLLATEPANQERWHLSEGGGGVDDWEIQAIEDEDGNDIEDTEEADDAE